MNQRASIGGVEVSDIRYIKLGRGGAWANASLANARLSFGYHSIPHEVCSSDDWEEVRRLLSDRKSDGAITAGVNEVASFYELPSTCLWVTFAQGHLWWCFAQEDVTWIGENPERGPSRFRAVVGKWSNLDLKGNPLKIANLSSKLTKVANFRATICTISEEQYLVRKIQGVDEPIVTRARAAESELIEIAQTMIKGLHWADFETLVDLIFARSGWQRSSRVGGNLSDVDLILEQPTTSEKAFVQVKSSANQAVLDDYLERFSTSGYDRFFFVCHTQSGMLSLPSQKNLHLFSGKMLAEVAVKNGLFDWLIDRSS